MCAPAVIPAVMSVASFGVNAMAQTAAYNQAVAESEYQRKLQEAQIKAQSMAIAEQNRVADEAYASSIESASKSLGIQTNLEGVRLQQEYEAGVNKQLELRNEALRAEGAVLASGSNHGLTEELLVRDVERQRASYTDIITGNMKKQAEQSYWNMRGMTADAQSRANANLPRRTKHLVVDGGGGIPPSKAGLALGIIGGGLDAYNTFHIKKYNMKGDVKSKV